MTQNINFRQILITWITFLECGSIPEGHLISFSMYCACDGIIEHSFINILAGLTKISHKNSFHWLTRANNTEKRRDAINFASVYSTPGLREGQIFRNFRNLFAVKVLQLVKSIEYIFPVKSMLCCHGNLRDQVSLKLEIQNVFLK